MSKERVRPSHDEWEGCKRSAQVSQPHVYSEYDRPVPPGIDCGTDTEVQQHLAADTDINRIVARYMTTGVIPPDQVSQRQAIFADATAVGDYQDMLGVITAVSEEFIQLPSDIRARFENNPARMIDWLSDPSNYQEAVKLGLLASETAGKGIPDSKTMESESESNAETKKAPEE